MNPFFSSWPGLSRPSTSFFRDWKENVDARHKAGHDSATREELISLADF
jgi:hypothetical protein